VASAIELSPTQARRSAVRAQLLEREGPLPTSAVPDTSNVPWERSGWTAGKNGSQLLGRDGNERFWDVAWRVYPVTRSLLDPAEARRGLSALRVFALGIVRPGLRGTLQEPIDLDPEAGVPATVTGVHGRWLVDAELLEIFEFEYALEMYKPAAKRRFGYYALPVLVGDRFVGRLDAASDFASGVFRINALRESAAVSAAEREGIRSCIAELAAWLGLEVA
jgi:hypothetical protein